MLCMYVCMYVVVRGQQRYAVVFLVSGQWTVDNLFDAVRQMWGRGIGLPQVSNH